MSNTSVKSSVEGVVLETVHVGSVKVGLPVIPPAGSSEADLALYVSMLISQLTSVESRATHHDLFLARSLTEKLDQKQRLTRKRWQLLTRKR